MDERRAEKMREETEEKKMDDEEKRGDGEREDEKREEGGDMGRWGHGGGRGRKRIMTRKGNMRRGKMEERQGKIFKTGKKGG